MSDVKNQPFGSPVSSAAISALLQEQVVMARVAPVATAGHVGISAPAVVGAAGRLPGGREAGPLAVFDLASVSKPIVACTLARLAARGVLSFDAPLASLLPEARGTASAELPLDLLLAHRAGLDGHRALFAPVFAGRPIERARALRVAAEARRVDCVGTPSAEGFAPVYSDLGYLLLGAALEAATRQPLDELVWREVAEPLGLGLGSARQLRARSASFFEDVAPTEILRARGGVVRGCVHDENAWALSGHASSGHAGLFGTASDVLGFGQALLRAIAGRSDWLAPTDVERLIRRRPGGTLRAGFDGKSADGSSAGARCSPDTFGHLGFTGTSLWCDPEAGTASVLLTNRVHPSRENPRIRAARPLVHDALFAAVRAVLPTPPNP